MKTSALHTNDLFMTRLLLLTLLFFHSCSAEKKIAGEWKQKSSHSSYLLTLNKDKTYLLRNASTFSCELKYGSWKFHKDTLILNQNFLKYGCEGEHPHESIDTTKYFIKNQPFFKILLDESGSQVATKNRRFYWRT